MPRYYAALYFGKILDAADEADATDKLSQLFRDNRDDSDLVRVREIKEWEGDETQSQWWVTLADFSISAPTPEEAVQLGADKIYTREAEVKALYAVEA